VVVFEVKSNLLNPSSKLNRAEALAALVQTQQYSKAQGSRGMLQT
jgi:hypothetical protein